MRLIPGVRPYPYGHVGDGNIHLSFLQPPGLAREEFQSQRIAFNEMVFDLVHELGGSFSAEHGVGLLKLAQMDRYKNPTALAMMRTIKQALDPNGVLNPGKVVPGAEYSETRLAND